MSEQTTATKEIKTLLVTAAGEEVQVEHLGSFAVAAVEGSPIYIITALRGDKRLSTRSWGWFPDKERAIAAVLSNEGDLYERGWYPLIVIEEMEPGIIPLACDDKRWWFVWEGDCETGAYRPTLCPTEYEGVVNFGMG